MRLNMPATKSNLISLRKSLALTKEGYELLDEKRRILLNELNLVVHQANKVQHDLEDALQKSYDLVDRTVVTLGRIKVEQTSLAVDTNNVISISSRRLMGVSIPSIALEMTEKPPYYSSYRSDFQVDEAIIQFREVLKMLAQLAEKRITLMRLAKEVQKTIRKVNALEKIYIPYYTEAVKIISDRLDEESREAFSTLKLLKQIIKT
jgi:V/A-type H+/Na+-transporting ATPase subunit D